MWHKELIEVLPRKQLIAQWRELVCIARNVNENDTPNHLLVNKVMDYPITDFITYATLVTEELSNRGYLPDWDRLERWLPLAYSDYEVPFDELYKHWHNHRYFEQCYYNLQEKYDCGGITNEEWELIERRRIEHLEGMLFKKE